MNTTNANESWEEIKGKLKQKFAALTEEDFLLLKGKKEELINRLQQKLGKTKEEIEKLILEI